MKTIKQNGLVLMITVTAVVPASLGFAQTPASKKDAMTSTRRARTHGSHSRHAKDAQVAYDAKDKRYYSVAWAKAHHMKDKGGDTLTLIRKSQLPKDAKMSKAMKGKM